MSDFSYISCAGNVRRDVNESTAILANVKSAIRMPYAWPGGYPLAVLMSDGECLCVKCAHSEFRLIADSTIRNARDGWRAMASDINWEDSSLYCAHCNEPIESAYGDDESES